MRRYRYERGQTIPFWVFATLMTLTLLFFTFNYANTVRYQVRAQSAADSAATAALAGDAAKLNSVQTLLLAMNVQEFKVRSLTTGASTLLTGGDANCGTLFSTACINDLLGAVDNVQQEVGNYDKVVTALNSFQGNLTGNLTNPQSTIQSFFNNNCVALATDCDFKYTTAVTLVNGLPVVDEYACKKVPTFAAGLLPGIAQTYDAVGHTTFSLAPLQQNLDSANGFGGLANSVLTNNTPLFPNTNSGIYSDFAGLQIGTGTYATVPVKSTTSMSAAAVC